MMRAAVFEGGGRTGVVRCEPPAPGPGQVRVRLEGSGVCASNLPVWEGREWFTYPLAPGAPGHEGWGVIDEVGPDVSPALSGRRVMLLSGHAYAEWDVTDAGNVAPLPDVLGDVPCPGEPLACAVNVIRRAMPRQHETIVIVGVGFLGALLVRLAAYAGARVIATSRRPFALDLARQLGAAEVIPMQDREALLTTVRDRTDGRLADCVIEAIGSQQGLDVATSVTATRGRLVIAGYHQDGPRQVDMQQWNWRGIDVLNAHERDEQVYVRGMTDAIALLRGGVIDLSPLLTHRLPLDRLDEAFELMRTRPDGFLKACVTCGEGGGG